MITPSIRHQNSAHSLSNVNFPIYLYLKKFKIFSSGNKAFSLFAPYIKYHRQNCAACFVRFTGCTLSMTGCGMRLDHVIGRCYMNNLNSILIEGNMVRDPLLRSTPKGTSVCTFSLASNRFFKQDSGFEKEVSFFEVETWAKLAEACNNLGRKGRGVRVVGRLKQDRWTGNDGKQHSKIAIVAEHVEFRPEFKKDANNERAINAGEDLAMAAQEYPDDASLEENNSAPVMNEVLDRVTF